MHPAGSAKGAAKSARLSESNDGRDRGVVTLSGKAPRLSKSSIVRGQRVDDLRHFGDPRKWNPAEFGMFADRGIAVSKIDAEGLVASHIAVLPLDGRADGAERLIGCPHRTAKLSDGEFADTGEVMLDHVAFQTCHLRCSHLILSMRVRLAPPRLITKFSFA